VEKAIKALAWMVRVFEPPVYCYHEIVHNAVVVEQFRAQGVHFVDHIDEVPPGRPIMLSAHGSAPEVVAAARARGGVVIDAVCPLVTKVHHEVKVRSAKGYTIIYVGHEGHEEAVGTMAVAPSRVKLVERRSDVAKLDIPLGEPIALLTQTTLSQEECMDVIDAAKERYEDLWLPNRSDLCFATTNRQGALKAVAAQSDAVIVIGSQNSSNTVALEKVARASGCKRVIRINGVEELPEDLSGVVGVTAGASAPEALVRAVIEKLNPREGVSELVMTVEAEYFPPPPELRESVRALSSLIGLMNACPTSDYRAALDEDRNQSAADALQLLSP